MKFTEFEDYVRSGLDDAITDHADTSATWKVVDIARYLNAAIRDYSQHFPKDRSATITVVAGTQAYDLPDDILVPAETAIVDLAWQKNATTIDHLVRVAWSPGDTEGISLSGTGKGYRLWADQIVLLDAPSSSDAVYTIAMQYRGYRATCIPVKGEELYQFEIPMPAGDIDLAFWYTTSMCMAQLEASDAYLRQYSERDELGSRRDDSPVRQSSAFRMKQYERGVMLRKDKQPTRRLVLRGRR